MRNVKNTDRRNTVGIIGGYGRIGAFVVKELFETTNSHITVAGRDLEKAKNISESLGTRVSIRYVDVFQSDTLDTICQDCGIIINCAGPSTVILVRVANACLRHNCHYIDVGGYDVLYDLLKDKNEDIRKRELTFLISAGWIPGLSGIFPKYIASIASSLFETVDSLKIYYGGREKWSYTSCRDMVWTIFQDFAGIFKHGKWIKKNILTSPRIAKLPYPLGIQVVFPLFNNQSRSFAEEMKYQLFAEYVGSGEHSLLTGLVAIYIKMFMKKKKEKAAQILMKAIEENWRHRGSAGLVYVVVKGKQNNKERQIRASIFTQENYRLTGIVPAITAKMLMENKISTKGIYYLCEVVDSDYFMKQIAERGFTYSILKDW